MMSYFSGIQDFHFLRPLWLLALLPSAWLTWRLIRRKSSAALWQNVVSPELLAMLLIGEEKKTSHIPYYCLLLLWLLATLALAGPAWQQLPQAVEKRIDAQILVLDLSLSMFADDIQPSRLVRARHKISDLLQRCEEGITGLVVYSGDAHVVSPLTDDHRTILSLIPSLSPEIMPVPGSNTTIAIQRAQELLSNASAQQGHIILISDGVEPTQVDAIVALLRNSNYRLSILGVGTPQGAPIKMPDGSLFKDQRQRIVVPQLEKGAMQNLSASLGGRYADLSNDDIDINYLLSESFQLSVDNYESTERHFDLWQEEGPWLLLLVLPFASLAFRRGWFSMWMPGILIISFSGSFMISTPAHAFEWKDLWQTKNQQAQAYFNKEDYESAASTFKSSRWKASSYYKQGNYDAAIEHFSKQEGANGHYNRANALAKAGNLEEALQHYKEAMALNPEHSDAKFNHDLVKKLLEQQQKNNSDQQQNQDDTQNQDQDRSQNSEQQSNDSQENQNSDQQNRQQEDQSEQAQQKQNTEDGSENKQQENTTPEESEQQSPPEKSQANPSELADMSEQEKQQELQQWLRRIPDDPSGLLRRKFYLESRENQRPATENQW